MGGYIGIGGVRGFSTKNDDPDAPSKPKRKPRMTKAEKLELEKQMLEVEGLESPAKQTRKPRASKAKAQEPGKDSESTDVGAPRKMYVMKFNTPILPYSKFPLTQNKYIQSFLKQYEEDINDVDCVLGVHFPGNSGEKAKDAVGVEI